MIMPSPYSSPYSEYCIRSPKAIYTSNFFKFSITASIRKKNTLKSILVHKQSQVNNRTATTSGSVIS